MKPATHRRCNTEVSIVSLIPGHPFYDYEQTLHNRIASRAYELFEAAGRTHGHDVEHWLGAEAELLIPLQTKVHEIDDWIFIGADISNLSSSDWRIYAEPLRVFIAGKAKGAGKERKNGNTAKEILSCVEFPEPVSIAGSFAELRNGFLTIGFCKAARQIDKGDANQGEALASAHKHHLRADRMKALSHAAKEYAKSARHQLGRASKKQKQAREFLTTHSSDSAKALRAAPSVPNWTEETPHSPMD